MSKDAIDETEILHCTECEFGRLEVSNAIFAECDNCDAAFERREVGI